MRAKITELFARLHILYLKARYPALSYRSSARDVVFCFLASVMMLNAPSVLEMCEKMTRITRSGEPRSEAMNSFINFFMNFDPFFTWVCYGLGAMALAQALIGLYILNETPARKQGRSSAFLKIEELSRLAHKR